MNKYEIPPRPEGGYPDEFFTSWGTDSVQFAKWYTAYQAANPGDVHGDLTRWLAKVAESTSYVNNEAMRTVTVRLPESMIERAEAEGRERRDGRSGVIRDSLVEHWERAQ